MRRSRKAELAYIRYLRNADPNVCDFCAIQPGDKQFAKDFKAFKVIHNRFPYSMWDEQTVVDHLMITPKRHTDNLSGMTPEEKVEYVAIIEQYEALGYNIYSRAPVSVIKSVPHQHTHLIKPAGNRNRLQFSTLKPYLRIVVK